MKKLPASSFSPPPRAPQRPPSPTTLQSRPRTRPVCPQAPPRSSWWLWRITGVRHHRESERSLDELLRADRSVSSPTTEKARLGHRRCPTISRWRRDPRAERPPTRSWPVIDRISTAGCRTTVWNQLESAGRTWAVYQEGMPSPCYGGVSYKDLSTNGQYALKHNPATPFPAVWDDQALCRCACPAALLDDAHRLARRLIHHPEHLQRHAWFPFDGVHELRCRHPGDHRARRHVAK